MASGQLKATLQTHTEVVLTLSFAPDSKTLATLDFNARTQLYSVQLWDAAGGQLKADLPVPPDGADYNWLFFAPDGQTLASEGYNPTGPYTIRLWDVASGQLKATVTGGAPPVAFSPDSKTLATGNYSEATHGPTVQLRDVASGQLKATLADTDEPIAFSPDSKTLATVSYDATGYMVRLWDVASGQPKATLPPQRADASSWGFAFSSDSKTLAAPDYYGAREPGTVRLWDAASGQLKATLTGAFVPLTFSPDSKTLATVAAGGVGLWDVASGRLKATLPATQLAFSTDGKTLATRGYSGPLHLWDVALASPIPITAQTSLAQFSPWLTHPFSWSGPGVSLLDPVD